MLVLIVTLSAPWTGSVHAAGEMRRQPTDCLRCSLPPFGYEKRHLAWSTLTPYFAIGANLRIVRRESLGDAKGFKGLGGGQVVQKRSDLYRNVNTSSCCS